jgi:tRNA-specific 2-thiouridylase
MPDRTPSSESAARSAGPIIVGISGGVDSAVAALLLKQAGLFMSNWEDDEDSYCTTASDFQDARKICDKLDIPLHRVSFAAEYRDRVFAHFVREYAAGRTPNPDVLCNREIKFGVCLDYMHRLGAARIATGHYARLIQHADGPQLLKAIDANKDQSYFLHAVSPHALADTVFPIGALRKDAVRKLAHAAGISVFDKRDSTGICFIGERPFADFLARYVRTEPGPIETDRGQIIGEHRGLAFYTLGQRSGLKLGGRAGAAAAPWYVADKNRDRNALIVVQDQNHPLLLSDAFDVEELSWIGAPPAADQSYGIKTRYRQADLACRVQWSTTGLRVNLAMPARAVTPGQYAVFYAGDRCLGGGVIARRFSALNAPATARIAYN